MITINIDDLGKCSPRELRALSAMIETMERCDNAAKKIESFVQKYEKEDASNIKFGPIKTEDLPTTGFPLPELTELPNAAPSIAVAEVPQTAPEGNAGTSIEPTAPLPHVAFAQPEAVPPVPAPAVSNPAPGVELDAAGVAWDAELHTRTKSKRTDGTWKMKRGSDEKMHEELTTVATILAPTETTSGAVPPPYNAFMPPLPPAVVVPPPPPTAMTFQQFMHAATEHVAAQRLNQAQLVAIARSLGLENILLLAARPDLIDAAYAEVRKVTG